MNPVAFDRVDAYDPGYLVVHDGRIESIGSADPRPQFPDAEFLDFNGDAILPGFVDTHVHLPQFAIMGLGSESLLDWLDRLTYPEEARFSDPEYARLISESFFDALLANGTTCASVYCSIHEHATDIAFEAARSRGIRAFIGKAMMDRHAPPPLLEDTGEAVDASIRLHEKWDGANGGRLRYVFTPRFAGSCSMELMQRTGNAAKERNAFIQTHLSENKAEVDWIRSLFPERSSYTDVYDFAGLLGRRTIVAHCIHLSNGEIGRLSETETNIAFCPYSNRTLRSGVMPFARLRDAGLKVGLGSDVSGGPSLSMFRQMGEASNSTWMSPRSALYLATLGGAEALNVADRTGNFAPGKDADFVIVDHRRTDPIPGKGAYNSPDHVLSRLCYRADSDCIRDVYLTGHRV